jgi:hypothetical protein
MAARSEEWVVIRITGDVLLFGNEQGRWPWY